MQLHDLNRILIRRGGRKKVASARVSNRLKPAGFTGLLVISLLITVAVIATAGLYAWVTTDLPSVEEAALFFDPQNGLILQPSRLYDRSGEQKLIDLDNPASIRAYVWLDAARDVHFSPLLVQAITVNAQPDFWKSSGADWSHWSDAKPHTIAEGLVERLLLWREEPSTRRALRMRLLAWQMTSRYGREQVLEWYMNSVSFGRQVTGAESAARVYFGKPSAEVNPTEIALLAGLTTAPALNPHDSPQAAADLTQTVLDRLKDAGVYSAETKKEAESTKLAIVPPVSRSNLVSPAFTRMALQQLSALVSEDRAALGGLHIITTLDIQQQAQLDCALRAQLSRLESVGNNKQDFDCDTARLLPALPPMDNLMPAGLLGAGVLIDPARGEVLALSGKTSLEESTDSYEGLQGGTVLNPFLAAAAFSRGYSPASMVWDLPANLEPDTVLLREDAVKYRGPIRLRTALISDRLNPLENLLAQLGARNTWRLTRPLGLEQLETVDAPEKILEDGVSVSLMEVAQGMSVFANLGDLYGLRTAQSASLQPSTLISVEDSYGQSLLDGSPVSKQSILSASLGYLVHHVLADEGLRRAELGYPNPFELGRPSGAKYGSADNGGEIWAAGYTPQRVAVIWMGAPEGSNFPGTLGVKAAGGVWNAVIRQSLMELPVSDWTIPPGVSTVEVCEPSGLLPTRICPSRVTEVFLQGSEPNTADNLYRTVQINRETGRIATVFTLPGMLEEEVFLSVPEFARDWARAAGKDLPPTDYDSIQAGAMLADVKIDKPELFSLVSGTVVIHGSAGGDGFQNYRLQVGEGLNPQKWLEVAKSNSPVTDGKLGEWDTNGGNGLYAIRLLVGRNDNRIETALSQVTVDNLPPEITIINPQANIAVSGAKPVFMQANITDTSDIVRVEWFIDGKPIGQSQQPPYAMEWESPLRGNHTLTVSAQDTAGNQAESVPLPLIVE